MGGAYELIGFLLLSLVALLAGVVISGRRPDLAPAVRNLLLAGLALRIVGSSLRYEVFFRFYEGGGDAGVYYYMGLFYAEHLRALDFGILFDSSLWALGQWWGTQFIRFLSGFVLAVIGPSMRAEFLAFSLLAFGGLLLYGRAFRQAYPWVRPELYLRWILLWPSLWFWPSSVGKEAAILLALGLAAAGHVGDGRKPNWLLLAAGIGLAFAIRPHVAAVLIVSAALSSWFLAQRRGGSVLRTVLVALLALVVTVAAFQRLGVDTDIDSVQDFMQQRAQMTSTGGSEIAVSSGGWSSVPMAFVNILMRPFPWEAHHALAMVSSLEMVALWFLVWRRRKNLWKALRQWNRNRFLSFALIFTLFYVVMIGLVFFNLGIIARQRVLVFPSLFLLLEARAIPAGYVARLKALHERRRLARQGRPTARTRPQQPTYGPAASGSRQERA